VSQLNNSSMAGAVQSTTLTSQSTALRSQTLISGHPDAVKRRQAAELRRRKQRDELAAGDPAQWWTVVTPSNMVTVSSCDSFNTALANNPGKLVVVNFFSPCCHACKTIFPKVKNLAVNNPEVVFLKVNGADEKLQAMCESMGITKIPFFQFYKNEQLLSSFAANLTKISYLRAEIAAHKACDSPGCLM
jgi:thiol-disulfide isomerase/thioredoxin